MKYQKEQGVQPAHGHKEIIMRNPAEIHFKKQGGSPSHSSPMNQHKQMIGSSKLGIPDKYVPHQMKEPQVNNSKQRNDDIINQHPDMQYQQEQEMYAHGFPNRHYGGHGQMMDQHMHQQQVEANYQYMNDNKPPKKYKDYYSNERIKQNYDIYQQQMMEQQQMDMPPHFQYMPYQQHHGQIGGHGGGHHYPEMNAHMGYYPGQSPPNRIQNLIRQNKNYASEYQSDPDALLNLIEHQKGVAGAEPDKKKKQAEEEYLSFSEASEDYEYYFCRVKKNKQGNVEAQEKGGTLVNAEVVEPGMVKHSSKNAAIRNIRNLTSNKNKYETPLNLINESSQENISVEIQGRIKDKADLMKDMTGRSRGSQNRKKEKNTIDLSSNQPTDNNQQNQAQQSPIDQTISSIREIGRKSNSLLISTQNESNILSPPVRKSHQGALQAEDIRYSGKTSPEQYVRDGEKIQVYGGKQQNARNMPLILNQDSGTQEKKGHAPHVQIEILETNKQSNMRGNDKMKKQQNPVILQEEVHVRKKDSISPPKSKTVKQSKHVPAQVKENVRKSREKTNQIIQIQNIDEVQKQQDALAQVHQINLKSKGINMGNSQDTTQPATGNDSSKQQIVDSKLKITAKIDSSRKDSPGRSKSPQMKTEKNLNGNHQRKKSGNASTGKKTVRVSKESDNVNIPPVKSGDFTPGDDNPFGVIHENPDQQIYTPKQTKYTEDFPSALAYPKNNFPTPFGAVTNSDVSALTQQKQRLSTNNFQPPLNQIYGETGPNKDSRRSSFRGARNTQYIASNKSVSDRKSYKSFITNTTAMIDEMSMPDERSIDFKVNDFGQKNLRQIVKEEEQILFNKINKVPGLDKKLVPTRQNELKKSNVKYEPINKSKSPTKQQSILNKARADITPGTSFPSTRSRPPVQPRVQQRPRIKHTFRGGNSYEHVSISPQRNKNLKPPQPPMNYERNTVASESKQIYRPPIQKSYQQIKGKQMMSQKPMQAVNQSAEPSISMISSPKKPQSPMPMRASIQQSEQQDYKQLETVEIDNVYQSNVFKSSFQSHNSSIQRFEQQYPQDHNLPGGYPPYMQQRIMLQHQLDERAHAIRFAYDHGQIHPSMMNQEEHFYLNQNYPHGYNPHNHDNFQVPRDEFQDYQQHQLTLSLRSNQMMHDQESSQSRTHNSRSPQRQKDSNDSKPKKSEKGKNQKVYGSNRRNREDNLTDPKPSEINNSLRNSRNEFASMQQNLNSEKFENRKPLKSPKKAGQEQGQDRNEYQHQIPSIVPEHNIAQGRQITQDQMRKSHRQKQNQQNTPQVFDGSSFGGSQVSQHHFQHSAQQSQLDPNNSNPTSQLQTQGLVSKFMNTMDNRPYVPKATVILNQDTDIEPFDIQMMEQRQFSQTVVETPSLVQSQKSNTSLNISKHSKKSLDQVKVARGGAITTDSQNSGRRIENNQILQNRELNKSRQNKALNTLYSKTESEYPTKTYLKKGQGAINRWSRQGSQTGSATGSQRNMQQENEASSQGKRSDSQKPSNLYFKALKDVPPLNQKEKDRSSSKGSQSSAIQGKKNEPLVRVPQSKMGGKVSDQYYSVGGARNSHAAGPTKSYKQRQISSIEKLKKEITRSHGSQDSSGKHSKELLDKIGNVRKGSYTGSSQGSRGSLGKSHIPMRFNK